MVRVAVESGQAGLEVMTQAVDQSGPLALILLDAMMPYMDGFTFAQRLRENSRFDGTSLLLLSSACQRGEVQRCREPSDLLFFSIRVTPQTSSNK